jgi:hypothetical protein
LPTYRFFIAFPPVVNRPTATVPDCASMPVYQNRAVAQAYHASPWSERCTRSEPRRFGGKPLGYPSIESKPLDWRKARLSLRQREIDRRCSGWADVHRPEASLQGIRALRPGTRVVSAAWRSECLRKTYRDDRILFPYRSRRDDTSLLSTKNELLRCRQRNRHQSRVFALPQHAGPVCEQMYRPEGLASSCMSRERSGRAGNGVFMPVPASVWHAH